MHKYVTICIYTLYMRALEHKKCKNFTANYSFSNRPPVGRVPTLQASVQAVQAQSEMQTRQEGRDCHC